MEEYLNRTDGTDDEASVLSPQTRAGIGQGLAEVDAGKLIEIGQVRQSLAEYKAEWQASRR